MIYNCGEAMVSFIKFLIIWFALFSITIQTISRIQVHGDVLAVPKLIIIMHKARGFFTGEP